MTKDQIAQIATDIWVAMREALERGSNDPKFGKVRDKVRDDWKWMANAMKCGHGVAINCTGSLNVLVVRFPLCAFKTYQDLSDEIAMNNLTRFLRVAPGDPTAGLILECC